jgi:hypothetical protein
LTNIRLKLIISTGGARGDFVAGWAGLLHNVIDNWWTINPLTGKSSGFFKIKFIDYGQLLHDILKDNNLQLDPESKLFLINPCHGHLLTPDVINQLLDTGAVEMYFIDHRNLSKTTLSWEFIVKTYLTHTNTVDRIGPGPWAIDQHIDLHPELITDAHRITAIKNIIKQQHRIGAVYDDKFLNNPCITLLDYHCLFRPGGSYYLCEKLNLIANVRLHNYWNHMLTVAQSPDSIDALGYTWRKTDFFN